MQVVIKRTYAALFQVPRVLSDEVLLSVRWLHSDYPNESETRNVCLY
jgi:hypothetical protein